jgi:class 3 adenylate cyclase
MSHRQRSYLRTSRALTLLAERMEPAALIGLWTNFAFDEIVTRHGLEKLKTIGDAYMAVAGVPTTNRRRPRGCLPPKRN